MLGDKLRRWHVDGGIIGENQVLAVFHAIYTASLYDGVRRITRVHIAPYSCSPIRSRTSGGM
jgi:hypothetical protein